MRAGVHTGRPQRIGSDWLGVDVNIAARVMERAARGGLVVSQATMDRISEEDFEALGVSAKRIRKQVFSPKQDGVPADLVMYRVKTRRELPGEDEENDDVADGIVVGEMLFGLLRALARIRVTVAYAVILTGVTTVLVALGPRVQDRVISHASTNLHNLSHGHLGTLFVSAFVIDAGPIYVWLPGLMCLLALAELLWRSGRLVVAFAVGHIGATLLVAVGLTAAVELGWLSDGRDPGHRRRDELRRLGRPRGAQRGDPAAVAAGMDRLVAGGRPRRWWRSNRDFTDVGSRVGAGARHARLDPVRARREWTPARCLLLVVASAFGFLMLANNGLVR